MNAPYRIEGLLLDLDGVFYIGDRPISGGQEVLAYLQERQVPYRFITNTTTRSPEALANKLRTLGIETRPENVFTAVSATIRFLNSQGTPSFHLLLRDVIKPIFDLFPQDREVPDYVIIGDIGADWNYENLNLVFNMLMRGSNLLCMHRNKFWQGDDGLLMDIGAFVAALEHVSGKPALVMGKPSPAFFQQAIDSLGVEKERVAIVGDDIDSDIAGGQASGLQGILVETGKYRKSYAEASSTIPDATLPSIASLPELLSRRLEATKISNSDFGSQ